MRPLHAALSLACVVSGAGWALVAARGSGRPTADVAGRALLGGVAAVFVACAGYDLLAWAGVAVTWQRLLALDAGALGASVAFGAIEEGAKTLGLLLVVERGWPRRAVGRAAVGVCAAFAAIEAALTMHGLALSPVLAARVALAPLAHALLFVPVAFAIAAGAARGGRAWAWLPPALATAALLHGAGNLSLAVPGVGPVGYAAALLVPVVGLHLALRRPIRTGREAVPRAVAAG
jgi:RsiW-degrading membrane proteinase PrsW (M82 family)